MRTPNISNLKVGVMGLGYVGLPLAMQIATTKTHKQTKEKICRKVIGFDINTKRINELKNFIDNTITVKKKDFKLASNNIKFTSNHLDLTEADIFIVTVPTPINKLNCPDFQFLEKASFILGEIISHKLGLKDIKDFIPPIIIFESTVYPGATEEICIPIIEKESKLKYNSPTNQTFYVGYSPERINPGDSFHSIDDIVKITSGCNTLIADWINNFYSSIIKKGTHKASSIEVAEAAKIIENIQRDLNIALINELSIIFEKIKIDTFDVLEAAGTKWNFIPFRPGLVGGHCIGVDPYYLESKSKMLGYHPKVFTAGRKVNDEFPKWIVENLILNMSRNKINISSSNILILGITYKENCPDTRNTKVLKIIRELNNYHININVFDPYIKSQSQLHNIDVNFNLLSSIKTKEKFSVVICAVAHNMILEMNNKEWQSLLKPNGLFFDLKGIIPRELNPIRI